MDDYTGTAKGGNPLERYHNDIAVLMEDGHGFTVISRWLRTMKRYRTVTPEQVKEYCLDRFGKAPIESCYSFGPECGQSNNSSRKRRPVF